MVDLDRLLNLPYKKKGFTRKQRQLREFDEEWEIIRAFDRIMKYGDKKAAIEFVEQYKIQK